MIKQIIAGLMLGCFSAAASETDDMDTLTEQQRQIAAISSCAAKGNMPALRRAIGRGLDAGLGVNDIKEILVQLYAYCGFPRSLNALEVLRTTVLARADAGRKDAPGAEPGRRPRGQAIDYGTENQTKLCGEAVKGPLFDFAPAIDEYLKAHLFGDIFSRDNVDWKTRELATIAALSSMEGTDGQLAAHIRIGRRNGLTEAQVKEILGLTAGEEPDAGVPRISPFPVGQPNTNYAQYFTGRSWLARLASGPGLNVPMANVTFEPGCRNNWHSHTGGQILVAVGGEGLFQERGKAARRLLPGDVVEIAPGVVHWHGAAPDSWFSHLAVECNPQTNENTWLERVSDEEYAEAARETTR
ncbi:MAG: carboxymuconolactone decarboxylase family protein [Akkermansiaceae bacterium]|nr:carboxymuconolactone decarboxylase family protein [Akkermansiaceae bacterium]